MATDPNKPILPRFKDKVMFISAKDAKQKMDKSYVISSSFKGILRLSPNNTNTTFEKNDIQLSIEDDLGQANYSDAIKFDDEALSSINSEADISKRMIIGSDSDGYIVNFRFSEQDIEFDNLGVIGITQAKSLQILTQKNDREAEILTLNGAKMPTLANDSAPIQFNTKSTFDDWDEQEIRVTGKHPDNSALIYGTLGKNNKRIWSYKKTSLFIKQLIMEALLELETIPTGSIHWFPVNLTQYKELVNKNGGRHNKSFTSAEETTSCDPLVRDFLLCDGRKYMNRDFPELAKTLWNEKITHWTHKDGHYVPTVDGTTNTYPDTYVENDKEKLSTKCFRVPDLRHLFITSIQCEGGADPAAGLLVIDSLSTGNNTTVGTYTPDSIVDPDKKGTDNHRHFTAYGSWQPPDFWSYSKTYTNYPNNDGQTKPVPPSNSNNLSEDGNDKIGIISMHNRPYQYYSPSEAPGGYIGFGERNTNQRDRRHRGTESVPSYMFMSRPNQEKPTLNQNFVGLSSFDYPSVAKVNSYEDLGLTNSMNGDTHIGLDTNLYGNENTGKFYAFLPLIKI